MSQELERLRNIIKAELDKNQMSLNKLAVESKLDTGNLWRFMKTDKIKDRVSLFFIMRILKSLKISAAVLDQVFE